MMRRCRTVKAGSEGSEGNSWLGVGGLKLNNLCRVVVIQSHIVVYIRMGLGRCTYFSRLRKCCHCWALLVTDLVLLVQDRSSVM